MKAETLIVVNEIRSESNKLKEKPFLKFALGGNQNGRHLGVIKMDVIKEWSKWTSFWGEGWGVKKYQIMCDNVYGSFISNCKFG